MRTLLPILLLAGCSSKAPPASEPQPVAARPAPVEPAPEPAPEPAAVEPLVPASECIEECMHASMAEARSAEAIRADCEAACGTGEPTTVSTGAELALMGGKRVKASGVVKRGDYPTGGNGTYVELSGGAKLWVAQDGVPDGWDTLIEQSVTVVGTLTQGPTSNGQRIRIPFLQDPEDPVRAGEMDAPL